MAADLCVTPRVISSGGNTLRGMACWVADIDRFQLVWFAPELPYIVPVANDGLILGIRTGDLAALPERQDSSRHCQTPSCRQVGSCIHRLFWHPEFPLEIEICANAALVRAYLPNAISLVTLCQTRICLGRLSLPIFRTIWHRRFLTVTPIGDGGLK
jgi:hypothetical protein